MAKILTDSIIPNLKGKTDIKDSGWVNATMASGWFSLTNMPLQCRKLAFPGGGV